MIAAHGAATLLCALLIAAAEHLYRVVSSVAWTLRARFEPDLEGEDRPPLVSHVADRRREILGRGPVSRRGPPTRAAVVVVR
jgi:hypothetical protein